ncbi:MAG: hypothetical protein JW938_01230 [Candidatus Omnitrophica bacterium]|nr:hypothetical protein [Candidatus Omnitrophota bacterium]
MGDVYLKKIQEEDDRIFTGNFPGDDKVNKSRVNKTLVLAAPIVPIFLILWWIEIGNILHVLILTALFSFIFSFLIYLFFFDEDNFFRWFTGPRG